MPTLQKLAALTLLLFLPLLAACQKPQPTLVVLVGGLGVTQLGDIETQLSRQCPNATVVSAGGFNGYQANLNDILAKYPHRNVVLIGHSLGGPAIAQTAEQLPRVDLAVFIDPSWDDFKLPRSVNNVLWFQRSDDDMERPSQIAGAGAPRTIPGKHNDIPHSPHLIDRIVAAVNPLSTRKPLTPADRTHLAAAFFGPE
jgi:pimeloyl-ACP methyl ester carboxylesterase